MDDACILFVADRPQKVNVNDPNEPKPWADFVYWATNQADSKTNPKHEPPEWKGKRIAENIWQLQLKTSLPFLGHLAASAEKAGLPYRFLLFSEPPNWVCVGCKPHHQNGNEPQNSHA